jgi:hypothetical protein
MKRSHLTLLTIIFILLSLASCKEKAKNSIVSYEVTTNNGNFDIVYIDGSGNRVKNTINSKNWETSFIGKKNDSVSIFIKAKNKNDKIVAKIIYDGKIIKKVTTYGKYSNENIKANISTTLPY